MSKELLISFCGPHLSKGTDIFAVVVLEILEQCCVILPPTLICSIKGKMVLPIAFWERLILSISLYYAVSLN